MRRQNLVIRGALVGLAVFTQGAYGAPDETDHVRRTEPAGSAAPPRNYFNLRVGAGTTPDGQRTQICGEVAPTARLSIEGCGNGAQLFLPDAPSHFSHYGFKVGFASWRLGSTFVEARAGLGFTELELGDDGLGFNFDGAGARGESTTGPEASAALRAIWALGPGFELITELRTAAAYLHHAPALVRPQARWQPSLALTAGVGF